MKQFDNHASGGNRDAARRHSTRLGRRDLMKGGAGTAVTQVLGSEVKAAGTTRKIALEEHFATPELAKKYVARPTRSDTLFADIERRLADFDGLRLETMDKAGIDLAVLSVTTPGVQAEKDAKTATRLARDANDLLAREVQKRPKRYAGFAHLPMQDAGAAAVELERAVKELRFKGALINGQTNGTYLDADNVFPVLGARAGSGRSSLPPSRRTPRSPGNVCWPSRIGRPGLGLDGRHRVSCFAARLRRHVHAVSETEDHSRPHGRDAAVPAVALRQSMAMQLGEELPPDALPSAIIRRHFAITTAGVCAPAPLAEAIASLGDDSVMFSVDYPYEDTQAAAAFIESAPISEAVRAKVCHGNAERILQL